MKLILVSEDAWLGPATWGGRGQEEVEKVLGLFSFEPWKKKYGLFL
jgi:hypothetical protein